MSCLWPNTMQCVLLCFLLGTMKASTGTTTPGTPPNVNKPSTPGLLVMNSRRQNVRMPCHAAGNPKPTLTWYKNGIKFKLRHAMTVLKDGTLLIKRMYPKNQGFYQCRANNSLGTSLSQLQQIQFDIMKKHKRYNSIKTYLLQEGDGIALPCSNIPDVPLAVYSIHWYLHGHSQMRATKRIGIDYNTKTLYFAYTIRSDKNTYKCGLSPKPSQDDPQVYLFRQKTITFKNLPQRGDTKPQVAAANSPVKATKGKRATLQCFFFAKPVAAVHWYDRHGKEITTKKDRRYQVKDFGRRLDIYPVEYSDEGKYTCRMVNRRGQAKSAIYLNVTTPPIPVYIHKPQSVQHVISETGLTIFTCVLRRDCIIYCRSETAPDEAHAATKWYRNGRALTEDSAGHYQLRDHNTRLNIIGVTKTDEGNFQCNSSNSEGYVFQEAYLQVKETK